MKKRKIVIINRGKGLLHLHHTKNSLPGKDKIRIRSRKVIRPGPGMQTLQFFYDDRTVLMEASLNGKLNVQEIVSPLDNRYMGKSVALSEDIVRLKITCTEQFSIASIVEGVDD